ncbi:RNA polymerase ECF-type sigma factor [Tenacibaculum maritimum]|uniref:RNA polymerase sigma factor n=1 Tax=Tenacibaculum maritimum TaxID=107401 RepID=UPI0012E6AF10|nr:sigma-70 family RNA polymerase sigma factor [Tenacibaculum maritimum]CAA0164872.1 RNA polymerase ECF-type sigma factor [Tenacibaculum maritimum]CAA0166693.1 RNA polymerase ECF-type sigma factor [Tenacibaculum maritimum]CAA0199434.1 RNA polymerase ECF-type sigma factor [Tenacibaculum maritimum]
MKNLSDELIWRSLKEGNIEAFEILFKNFYPRLFNYGLKISRDIVLTEDSLQDFFLYIYERRQNLSSLETIAPYLFSSYRRFIIKMIQKGKKSRMLRDLDKNMIDLQFTPEEVITKQEATSFREKNLTLILNKLPKRQREVIYLKYYCDLKTIEIAEVMEINYQSVINTIHKAIKNLREDVSISHLLNS